MLSKETFKRAGLILKDQAFSTKFHLASVSINKLSSELFSLILYKLSVKTIPLTLSRVVTS